MRKGLEEEMHNYFIQRNEAEKKSVIQMLKKLLKIRKGALQRATIEQYNKELEEAEKQIEKGNFITQEELEKEMEKW
jgi:hypothetical protein